MEIFNFSILILIITYSFVYTDAFPLSSNETEGNIILDLIKEFQIRQCIFLSNEKSSENIMMKMKIISSLNVFPIVFDHVELTKYIWKVMYFNQHHYYNTMVIFNEEHNFMVEEIFRFYNKRRMSRFLSKLIWIMFVLDVGIITNSKIKNLIPYECEFMMVESQNSTTYKLTELYSVKNKTFSFEYGVWDLSQGLKSTKLSSYRRRIDLNGTEIKIVIIDEYILEECPSVESDDLNCAIYEILNDFSKLMNAQNIRIIIPVEKIYEMRREDSYHSSGDILTPTILHASNSFSFRIGPIIKTTVNWYIKYPVTKLRSDYYLQPFERDLWLAFILSVIIINVLIVMTKYSLVHESTDRSLTDDLFFGIETFCNQSGSSEYRNIPFRISCWILRILSYVAIASFGAVITSFLTVEIPQIPFQNVEEFLRNGEYQLLATKNSFMYWILESSESSAMKNIYNNFTNVTDSEMTIQEIQIMCQEKFALTFDENIIYNHKEVIGCNIFQIYQPITFYWHVLEIPEDSPFISTFNHNLLRFYEFGIHSRMQNIINNPPAGISTLKEVDEDNVKPVEFKQMVQVLSIPFIGMMMAAIVIIGEAIHKRRDRF